MSTMSERIWIPPRPGISSVDSDSRKTTRQKILDIKKSRIKIAKESGYDNVYRTRLLHTKGLSFYVAEGSKDLTLWDIDLGNRALYGHGIGARLLQRAVQFSLHKNPDIQTVSRGEGNWALAKVIGKVLGGDEHVSFEKDGTVYGEQGDRPISTALVDHLPTEGQEYTVRNIVGSIDTAHLMSQEVAERGVRIRAK